MQQTRILEEHELGPVISTHRQPPWLPMIVVVFFMGTVILFSVLTYGMSTVDRGAGVAFLVMTCGLVAVTFLLLWIRCRRSHDKFEVREHGLSIHRKGKVRHVLWDDVKHVRRDEVHKGFESRLKTYPALTLETIHGEKVRVGRILDFDTFGNCIEFAEILASRIEEKTFAHRLKRCLTDIEHGQTLNFGDILAAREGLTFKNQTIPWAKLSGFHKVAVSLGGVMNLGEFVLQQFEGRTWYSVVHIFVNGELKPVHKIGIGSLVDYPVLCAIALELKGQKISNNPDWELTSTIGG